MNDSESGTQPDEAPEGVGPEPAPREETARARQPMKRRVLRWAGIGFGGLAAVLLLFTALVYLRGRSIWRERHEITPPITSVPTDSVTVARGAHIAVTRGCLECHGEQLQGAVFADAPPAFISAPNLTRGAGGVGSRYSAVDWDRAVRYGVRPDGSLLLPMMPYAEYTRLNDADMAALAAYLASRPAVDNQVPPARLKFFGYLMIGMSGLSRENIGRPRPMITPGPTPEYGAYFASTVCAACHGDRMEGAKGPPQDAPGLHAYGAIDVQLLTRALRLGIAADGRELNPQVMPWRAFQHMDDTEIAAVHAYLARLAGANPPAVSDERPPPVPGQ